MPPAQTAQWPLFLAASAVAVACSALSPLVVARRWAFVGEGVSHSGYGGAGLIWLLSLALPGVAFLREPAGVMLGVAAFSLITAVAVGKMTRSRRMGFLGFDAAVGIVLTASLAFGFLARSIYETQAGGAPVESQALLFGDVRSVDPLRAVMTLVIATGLLGALWLCAKEVLSYTFDPELAQVGGVPSGAVHYGLLLSIAAVVVVGSPLIGVVLITALLVLPGAIGALLGSTLGRLYSLSVVSALLAVLAAVAMSRSTLALPLGPLVVLALVAELALAAAWARLRG